MTGTERVAEVMQSTRIHQESASHALTVGDVEHWCLKALVDVDVPRLLAAVDEVLAFHQPEESRQGTVCGYCDDSYGEHAEWPCETYQAITRTLLGKEGGDER